MPVVIPAKSAGEIIKKSTALAKLAKLDANVLTGLANNGPALLADPQFGPIIKNALEIQ